MTKEKEQTLRWVLDQLKFVDVMAKMHVDNHKKRADKYKVAHEIAEIENRPDEALCMDCFHEISLYSHEYSGYMRREIQSMIDRVEAELPFVPTLTLVVDNKNKVPAGTGTQHIAKNVREKL
jgi:hypothetical protein